MAVVSVAPLSDVRPGSDAAELLVLRLSARDGGVGATLSGVAMVEAAGAAMSEIACVKCGSVAGWKGPVYRLQLYAVGYGTEFRQECLEFTCLTCGYMRSEPTKDAPPETVLTEVALPVMEEETPRSWFERVTGRNAGPSYRQRMDMHATNLKARSVAGEKKQA